MPTQLVSGMSSSLSISMVFACPSCKHLMLFKSVEPWTLMYGHQLDRYTFQCGDCGHLLTHMVDEDQL